MRRAFARGMLHGMRTNVPVWVRNVYIKYYGEVAFEQAALTLQPIFVEKYLQSFTITYL